MKMIDMKMDKKERKEMMEPANIGPEYPYETKIYIEKSKADSLGLRDASVDDKVTMVCQCEVVEISKDGCYLQIQKMGNKGMEPDEKMKQMGGSMTFMSQK